MDIQKLTKVAERNFSERAEWEKQDKARNERADSVQKASYATETDFWCSRCKVDFRRTGIKVVRTAWKSELKCAWYATRCEKCYKACIRYITDKHLDPYYHESEMLRVQRMVQTKDMLQPGDPGFKMYYGDPYQKYYDEMEAAERATFKKKIASWD